MEQIPHTTGGVDAMSTKSPAPTVFRLHYDHACIGGIPLICPSKESAAWLAKMMVLDDMNVASVESGGRIGVPDSGVAERVERYLLGVRPGYSYWVNLLTDGGYGYNRFWITEESE